MKTFTSFLEESYEIDKNIEKLGFKHSYSHGHNHTYKADKYSGGIDHETMHNHLVKQGYRALTHTASGRAELPPKTHYQHKNFGAGKIELGHKDGQVHSVHIDHNTSHD